MARLRIEGEKVFVDDHLIPAYVAAVEDREFPPVYGLPTWRVRNIRIPFENGLMLSVIWGMATYSDNYNANFGQPWVEEPEQVEVGLSTEDGLIGDPLCYVSVEGELLRLMELTAALPSGTRTLPTWWEDESWRRF